MTDDHRRLLDRLREALDLDEPDGPGDRLEEDCLAEVRRLRGMERDGIFATLGAFEILMFARVGRGSPTESLVSFRLTRPAGVADVSTSHRGSEPRQSLKELTEKIVFVIIDRGQAEDLVEIIREQL